MRQCLIAAAVWSLCAATAAAADFTTSFTYQGRLENGGSPASGLFDFELVLYDDATVGAPDNQIGTTVYRYGVEVVDGMFTTTLDFGFAAFVDTGLRYLEIHVRPSGTPAYTTLAPRQWITPLPQAIKAINAVNAENLTLPFYGAAGPYLPNSATLFITNNGADGAGVAGTGPDAGVFGLGTPTTDPFPGYFAGTGVAGVSKIAGVAGSTDTGYAVVGWAQEGTGGYFLTHSTDPANDYGLIARSTNGVTAGLFEVDEPTSTSPVLLARTDSTQNYAFGVHGLIESTSPGGYSTAVRGENKGTGSFGIGVWGSQAGKGYGVYGTANGGTGVYGYAFGPGTTGFAAGVRGEGGGGSVAGYFAGDVVVTGTLSKGGGTFRIDHPLDPENEYLSHSFVESPEMKNVYDGVVTLDSDGKAAVTMPDYFGALNTEFRYQLTCIGGYAPVYVETEIEGGVFAIAGGKPGLKVSWQVTGVRQDPWALANPVKVEEEKSDVDKGLYLHPAAYGLPPERGIGHVDRPKADGN
ncbi:MAG: hypothetical protein H6810_05705 [Phycisphaeraceae bacterium]|nr:MAG: hypothetical protein H6810_05705 [Phycisphaeraceae bacterium]